MRTLYWFVMAKSKMSQKAKLSIYRSIYNPTLTYGHELWVVTEKNEIVDTSRRKAAGLSLSDRVRSSDILEELGVKSLLLCVKRTQPRWFGHLVRMPPGRLPGEVFRACPTGRSPWADVGHNGELSAVLETPWCLPGEVEDMGGERRVWASLLRLLAPRPRPT